VELRSILSVTQKLIRVARGWTFFEYAMRDAKEEKKTSNAQHPTPNAQRPMQKENKAKGTKFR